MNEASNSRGATPLETQTILILFIEIVIVVIYLIILLLIVVKNAKKFLQMQSRNYYLIVTFYIVSKLIICGILIVQIIVGIANQWTNIEPNSVEVMIKVGIVLADLSIIELFLTALQAYLTHCFSVISGSITKKRSNFLKYGIKTMQIIVGIGMVVPLLLFIVGYINFSINNAINLSMNISIIISFLVAFLYLNFEMTGIMMDKKINSVIKQIYKVQLVILISRAFSIAFQSFMAFYILPHTFQQKIARASVTMQKEIVLGIVFLGSISFILLTQALPIMYSLKTKVIQALNYKTSFFDEHQGNYFIQRLDLEQCIVDKIQGEPSDLLIGSEQMKLINFNQLSEINEDNSHSIWIYKKGQFQDKTLLIRKSKYQISNFIFEDVENEINHWNQLNLRYLSKINYFCEGQIIFLVQKYYQKNLDQKAATLKNEFESVILAFKIAKGIKQLHDNDIAHGCLCPKHIFFDGEKVKFNGLGLESLKKYLCLITGYSNKTIYTATEHLKDKNSTILRPKPPADIYSFGVIFYQLFTNNRDYRQLTLKEIQHQFVQNHSRPKLPIDSPTKITKRKTAINTEIKKLIGRCWNQQPENRPKIDEVIQTLKRLL